MHFACTCSVASWKDPLEGRFIVYMYAFSRWHWLRSDFLTTFRISRYQNTYTRTNRMSFKISGTNKKMQNCCIHAGEAKHSSRLSLIWCDGMCLPLRRQCACVAPVAYLLGGSVPRRLRRPDGAEPLREREELCHRCFRSN